jgi:hypothetical protein
MAIRYAVASGNWSNTATWDGGTLPAVGDDVRSNGFTVTVDGSYTALTVSNKSETSPTVAAGGTFSLANGSSVTATHATDGFLISLVTGHNVFTSTLTTGQSATLVGSCNHATGPGHTGSRLLNMTGIGGTVSIVGDISGRDTTTNYSTVNLAAACTLVVTGNVSGGPSNAGGAIVMSANNASVSVTGNVSATGSSTPSALAGGIYMANFTGLAVSVTGNVTAATNCPGIGANTPTGGSVTVTGTLTASANYPAISLPSYALELIASGPFISTSVMAPFYVPKFRWIASASGTYMQLATNNLLATRSLYTADYTTALHMPAITNVRSGTVYGPASELTGTCAVPPAGSVALGVPVDATTGTAALTQQAIADAVGPLIAAYGT